MGDTADASPRADHSGRLLLRMPKTLHAELAQRAEAEGVSLNQLIVGALSRAVGTSEPVAAPGSSRAQPSGADRVTRASDEAAPSGSAGLRAALVANLIVVAIAAVAAIVLLLVAWHRGF